MPVWSARLLVACLLITQCAVPSPAYAVFDTQPLSHQYLVQLPVLITSMWLSSSYSSVTSTWLSALNYPQSMYALVISTRTRLSGLISVLQLLLVIQLSPLSSYQFLMLIDPCHLTRCLFIPNSHQKSFLIFGLVKFREQFTQSIVAMFIRK